MHDLLITTGTSRQRPAVVKHEITFNITGHRGCRGLMPENSVQGFIEALKMGVHTLDMDIVFTADGELVVTNDLVIPSNNLSCEHSELNEKILYRMNYSDIRKFEYGRKINPLFPLQKAMEATRPLLSEVIGRIEKYILWNSGEHVNYNIEIKTSPDGDYLYHPKPEEIVLKLYDLLRQRNILHRCIIQSADVRPLQLFRRIAPKVRIALLVENECSVDENIEALGFYPSIYSPWFITVDKCMVNEVHQKEMKIIPWTVNEILDMNELMQMGVDGIVTDYPDIALKLIEK
jgi:glycerophosphoryl diester phosphodiesterase